MQVILSNPLLSFCFFAAVLLLLVSVIVGLLRRDFQILFSRIGLIHLACALGTATLLLVFRHALLGLPFQEPPEWFPEILQTFFVERFTAIFPETSSLANSGASLDASTDIVKTWPLAGISRLPLYIFALAYGPTAGLVAGLLFAPISGLGLAVYPEVLLGLELCILGWLAIVPSSYQSRWAGSFNALLAYVLTFFSAGFAYLLWRGLPLNVDSFWRLLHPSLGGVLLSCLLLFLFGPKFFKKTFKSSKIIFESIEAGLEDIVVDKSALSIVTTSESIKSSLDSFSPSVSTTLNIAPQGGVSETAPLESKTSDSTAPQSKTSESTSSVNNQTSKQAKQRGKKRKQSRNAQKTSKQSNQVHRTVVSSEKQVTGSDVTKKELLDSSKETNIFLTNADDLLRVTGVEGSVYSDLLSDLPDHLSEETLWLINFLLTEAKASSINAVYKAFKGSFGANKKRFKRGVKEAHAEGWLTLMRDIEKDEIFVGLGRKLLS